jgi:predicted XRE-type DNA-binding protein
MEGAAKKMLEFHANTLAFEQKMNALMRQCKKGFKKDGDRPGKRSLREWIKLRKIPNEESGVVVSMKVQAVEAGIKLSHLLIDFVFLMSRQDELAEKIWRFKSALKWVTEDGNFNSFVIDKVLILLEMAEEEVSEVKRSRELRNKGKAKLIDEGDQGERSSGRIRVHEVVDQYFEQTLYQIFGQFLEVVLRLESIVSHRYLPADSEMLMKEALSMVESSLRQYEEVLEWIRRDIITLKKMFPLKLEHKKDAKTTETIILVACRIDDLWWGALDNSSEEKDDISTNIPVFETKMQALMRECKEGLIKRAGNSEMNSSMGWMNASHTSESRSVITMKARVVVAGIELSNLVIDFVFMMSRRDELAEKIGEFKAAFKWATKLNSMVIDKVVNLLEMADREVRTMTRFEELKSKRKSVIDWRSG